MNWWRSFFDNRSIFCKLYKKRSTNRCGKLTLFVFGFLRLIFSKLSAWNASNLIEKVFLSVSAEFLHTNAFRLCHYSCPNKACPFENNSYFCALFLLRFWFHSIAFEFRLSSAIINLPNKNKRIHASGQQQQLCLENHSILFVHAQKKQTKLFYLFSQCAIEKRAAYGNLMRNVKLPWKVLKIQHIVVLVCSKGI